MFEDTCLAASISSCVECSEIHCTLTFFVKVSLVFVMGVLVSDFTCMGHESGRR